MKDKQKPLAERIGADPFADDIEAIVCPVCNREFLAGGCRHLTAEEDEALRKAADAANKLIDCGFLIET